MYQDEHKAWNTSHYPGTRQLCAKCDAPTGRCEDDSLYVDEDNQVGPLCKKCWEKARDAETPNAVLTGGAAVPVENIVMPQED